MKKIPALHIHQNNKGFSLIEVMVALGIFSIGILAVASMQISAAQGNLSARLRTEAVTFATCKLEVLMSQTYGNIDEDYFDTNPNSDNCNDSDVYTLDSLAVLEDTPINDTKLIELTVTWLDRGRPQSTTLNYIKADLDNY